MPKSQINIVSLANQLPRQKYPGLLIVIIILSTLIFNVWPQATDECEVLRVYDGDTITVNCQGNETKIRMYCIDTPEMGQTPWGKIARDHLRSVIGNRVKVISFEKDRYGRTVGEVYSGENNLNLMQVKTGQAAVYQAYCKNSEYMDAEQPAKNAKLGIWAKPGLQQTPWEWRKLKP